ncbi:TonB-dependent receptor domain-containing protein [Moheibacter stercoris]|uniref:Outer membrane receptor protein involved in Fe transport/copper chaperone CopZ n=1 Tax=Moheibacter stercoris TaxID=1628251 RepID=A0ABV2LR88_9FLAO
MFTKYLSVFLLLIGTFLFAQEITKTIDVKGNCGMCKTRIENAVKELPAASGTWDVSTKKLSLQYSEDQTSLEAIMQNVAKVGHDNELFRAEDSVYEALHGCCLYERDDATTSSVTSQNSQDMSGLESKTIKVRGNCGMCKTRIENAVKSFPSASGTWDIYSKVLEVKFDPKQTNFNSIMKKVAEVGHDNELFLADDSVYKTLPGCCLYDREISWDEVQNSKGTHAHDEAAHDHSDPNHSHDDHDHSDPNHTHDAPTQTTMNDESGEEGLEDLPTDDASIQLGTANISGNKAASLFDKKAAGLTENISDKELLKAACCNLSESFETNATVDVSYSNAVSGTKQLKMLGLDQKYVLMTKELLPEIRGIANAYGLNFIPGRWIQSIQLVKGAGTVTNGYESMVGHINTELYKSHDKAKTSLNFFADINTRFEGNFVHNDNINEKWTQSILLHGNATTNRQDHNDDGFMDTPIGKNVNLSYLLNYEDLEKSGIATHFGVNYLTDHRLAGQMDFQEDVDKGTTNNYGIGVDIQRFQFWNKTGYVFEGKPYQSIGWMNQFNYHEQESYFGLRTYDAEQRTFYSNLIFESIISNTAHKFKTGLSFLYDHYDELYNKNSFKRTETVPGGFFEYTYGDDKWTIVAGARVDLHNLAGTQFTPRLNVKYDVTPKTILRASAGRGFRTANIFADSQNYFASNREIEILPNADGEIYGLEPEIAWNYGISLQQEFRIFGRKSTVVADLFRTDFQKQVVMDLDNSAQKILFYNLDGDSYANSLQVQWDFQPIRRLDAKIAYKFYDTKTDYINGSDELPFTPQHRGFLNLAYATMRKANGSQWSFDTTLQWVGEQRLPNTAGNPHEFHIPEYGESYFQLNAQIAKNFNKVIRVYVGGENLLGYTQHNPIIDAQNPFGNYFDGGMVYAPVMPANFYIGLDIDF